jgi:hypothetical protein
MSRTYKDSPQARRDRSRRRRDISVRPVRRERVDTRKLSRAIIKLALAEQAGSDNTSPDNPNTTGPAEESDA